MGSPKILYTLIAHKKNILVDYYEEYEEFVAYTQE